MAAVVSSGAENTYVSDGCDSKCPGRTADPTRTANRTKNVRIVRFPKQEGRRYGDRPSRMRGHLDTESARGAIG